MSRFLGRLRRTPLEKIAPGSESIDSYCEFWNRFAATDSANRRRVWRRQSLEVRRERARDAQPYFSDDSVVLEIGCRIGRIMYHVAPHGRELHGMDISAEMIKQASANPAHLPSVPLHVGTGFELPAQAGQFDLAYSKYQQFLHS